MTSGFFKLDILAIALSCLCVVADGARILGVFPMPAKSHMSIGSALMKELARRGHQVTVFSPFPEKSKIENFTDIEFKLTYAELLRYSRSREMYDIDNMWHFEKVNFFWNMGIAVCDILFQDEALQNILYANNEKFDILITGAFIHDCVLGIAYKLNISVVKVCPFVGTKWMDEWAGNPTPYAYVPDIFQDMGERMTIWQRIRNTLGEIYIKLGRMFYAIPQQDAILRKYLKTSNIPSLWEMQKSIVLTLINHHFSIGYSRPLMPNIVEIGGIHIRPPRKLNADLQKFIDESPHGVIYFSMGSNLRSSDFKSETLTAFLEAFSKLKERVLWKWETESLPGQPSNVKLGKWMPQSDVLAHPNVKLFVSQGGLLSTQESIHRGVPIIGIPIYGDQRYNLAKIVTSGIGVQLDLANITTESVTWAMNEVLNNSRYRENVQRMSRTFRDQPLTPLDQAVFWTEYVIRHKGAPHMRSAALDLAWYQYFLLDVIAVLTLVTVSVLIIVFLILRAAFKIVFDTFPGKSMHFSKKNS